MRVSPACGLALLLGAAGCAGTATISEPGRRPRRIASSQADRPTVPLKACLDRGGQDLTRFLLFMFGDVGTVGADCDVLVDASITPYARDLSFREAATGRPLFSVRSRFTRLHSEEIKNRVVAEVRAVLADDGPLFKTIVRRSRLGGAPSAAPGRPAAAAAPADAVKAAREPEFPAEPDLLASPSYRGDERPDDLAVIVGVEGSTRAPAAYAERDAAAFRAHALALGVPEGRIAFLTGSTAGKASFEENVERWLPRLAKPDSRVYFFFSGRGAADAKTGRSYLVPSDGDLSALESTAYPMKRLYKRLSALPARQVFVALDAGFSGAGDAGRLTVLAASASGEDSASLDVRKHGAFTYFLLQGLDGAAKDASGKVTASSLLRYLAPRVESEARRLDRSQTPRLLGGDPDLVLR